MGRKADLEGRIVALEAEVAALSAQLAAQREYAPYWYVSPPVYPPYPTITCGTSTAGAEITLYNKGALVELGHTDGC